MGKRKNISKNKAIQENNVVASREEVSSLLERSKYTLDLVNSWVNGADTKVSISCGVFSVVVATIVFVAENIVGNVDKINHPNVYIYLWFHVAEVLTIFSFLLSLIFHLRAIYPSFFSGEKTAKKQSRKQSTQPNFSIFYDRIRCFKNATDYVKKSRAISEEQFIDEILKEAYYNSKICSKKMRTFRIGIVFAIVTIFLSVTSCILYYCAYTYV